MNQHVQHKCDNPECYSCAYGVFECEVCCGVGTTLTVECCGRKLTWEELGAIDRSELEYARGKWMKAEPGQVAGSNCPPQLRALERLLTDPEDHLADCEWHHVSLSQAKCACWTKTRDEAEREFDRLVEKLRELKIDLA